MPSSMPKLIVASIIIGTGSEVQNCMLYNIKPRRSRWCLHCRGFELEQHIMLQRSGRQKQSSSKVAQFLFNFCRRLVIFGDSRVGGRCSLRRLVKRCQRMYLDESLGGRLVANMGTRLIGIMSTHSSTCRGMPWNSSVMYCVYLSS